MVAKARVACVERGLDRERVHVGAGNHNFANLDLSEFDGAEDEFFFAGGEQAALPRLLDLDLQLFRGVGVAVFLFSRDAQRANESAETMSRSEIAQRKVLRNQRNGRATSKVTRSARARLILFRNEFADDHVQGAEEDEGGGKRESVRERTTE